MEKKKPQKRRTSTINKLVGNIQSSIDNLYKNSYFSTINNLKDLDNVKDNIDSSIDDILSNNVNSVGVPNISKLYARMQMKNGNTSDKQITGEIERLFNDPSMTDGILVSYGQNKYLKDLDEEVDLICKYMPQLEDALDAKKDNVLSADHFSKDFINVVNKTNIDNDITFNERIDTIKEQYNLLELFENIYDDTAHYGDQFIYILPYGKALSTELGAKNGYISSGIVTSEATNMINEGKIKISIDTETKKILSESSKTIDILDESIIKKGIGSLDVELNTTGILESAVKNRSTAQSIYNRKLNKTINDNIEFEGLEGSEGLIKNKNDETKTKDIKIPGCIVKTLKRENVIPIYIDDLCLGYYYLEYDHDDIFNSGTMTDPLMSLKAGRFNLSQEDAKKDEMIKHISGKLSSFIDGKFINANQDLRKEIYMILKHNNMFNMGSANQLKVTYIPPEDIVHVYFKRDSKTHRGISDLEKSLLPAKLYTSLYVTNTIGVLTRGQDKRVYYVKQNIDSNISQTLLNTINQIKKSNFGARELSSVKNILNITGQYNDYIIPVGPSGDSPINFEIMQGQNIETKTELMNSLEQMAINGTDVPYEFVQARQTVDYAVRLTMSNGKFLRKVFKRQAIVQKFFSRIITKIYNTEFMVDDELEVNLPPPAFLNIVNTNQMIQNTNEYVANIVEMEAGDEDEEVKAIFTQKLKRYYLSTYLDLKSIQEIKEKAVMESKMKKKTE